MLTLFGGTAKQWIKLESKPSAKLCECWISLIAGCRTHGSSHRGNAECFMEYRNVQSYSRLLLPTHPWVGWVQVPQLAKTSTIIFHLYSLAWTSGVEFVLENLRQHHGNIIIPSLLGRFTMQRLLQSASVPKVLTGPWQTYPQNKLFDNFQKRLLIHG